MRKNRGTLLHTRRGVNAQRQPQLPHDVCSDLHPLVRTPRTHIPGSQIVSATVPPPTPLRQGWRPPLGHHPLHPGGAPEADAGIEQTPPPARCGCAAEGIVRGSAARLLLCCPAGTCPRGAGRRSGPHTKQAARRTPSSQRTLSLFPCPALAWPAKLKADSRVAGQLRQRRVASAWTCSGPGSEDSSGPGAQSRPGRYSKGSGEVS